MEATSSKTLMFLVAIACIAAAGSASPAPAPAPSADVEPQELGGCLTSLLSIEGCFDAIRDAIKQKKFDTLKPDCCKAITELGDNCWTMIFPDQPYVPVLLHGICKFLGNDPKLKNLGAPKPSH